MNKVTCNRNFKITSDGGGRFANLQVHNEAIVHGMLMEEVTTHDIHVLAELVRQLRLKLTELYKEMLHHTTLQTINV